MPDKTGENRPNGSQPQKLTSTQRILIGGFVIVIAAIAVVGYFIYQALNREPEPVITQAGSYVIDESNLSDVKDKIQSQVMDGMYEVNMNTTWYFESGEVTSTNAYVANATSNRKPVFIEVVLAETEELIYTSTVIPVGNALKAITLEKELAVGKHNAVCTYNLLGEDNNISSSFGVNITLEVE